LLLAYITAGNEWIEARQRLDRHRSPRALKSALDEVRERRSALRERLAKHQQIHRRHSRSNS
jgi:hypothetical protein